MKQDRWFDHDEKYYGKVLNDVRTAKKKKKTHEISLNEYTARLTFPTKKKKIEKKSKIAILKSNVKE